MWEGAADTHLASASSRQQDAIYHHTHILTSSVSRSTSERSTRPSCRFSRKRTTRFSAQSAVPPSMPPDAVPSDQLPGAPGCYLGGWACAASPLLTRIMPCLLDPVLCERSPVQTCPCPACRMAKLGAPR